ncbi:MAG: response regulator [Planctomycetes bacterium]|nr:response regulator [Planctomycetota bacterium]
MNKEKERVLVIDDEESIQKSLSLVLAGEGYDVTVVGTGGEGLEKFNQHPYDAVILDYKLPDTDGLNVARVIKERDPKVALVFVTAYSSIETALTVMKLGAFDFLEKPLHKDVVLSALKRSLLTKKLMEEEKALDRPNILVVDDEHVIRFSLEESLKASGYSCRSCASGHEALRKVEEELFHILIADLKLEDMEGTELIRKVREYFPEMMAIVITGAPSVTNAVEALKAGAFDYIMKPLEPEDVLSRIKIGWEKHRNAVLVKQLLHSLQVANLEMEKANQRLNALSVTDNLTSLYNHRYVMDTLAVEYQKARQFQRKLSVMILDLDHFRAINDRYGHQVGDAVLVELGAFLKESARSIDIVGRYGGEEFCLILPEADGTKATVMGEKLRQAIAKKQFTPVEGISINLTASMGISSLDEEGVDSVAALLNHVDKALYEAKVRGRNRVVCWEEIKKKSESPNDKNVETAVLDYEHRAGKAAKELKEHYIQSVKGLVNALEAKDGYTATHSYLVSYYAKAVAKYLKLSEEEVGIITTAGLLHDIGKIGIPDAVLNKEGSLNEEERSLVRRHPETGAKILGPIGFLNRELELIYAHQERWDGQGYPYGLKGNDIPYGARILALCDAFEAMTSKRPYRKAPFTAARACEIISGEAGKQLDPSLVMPFMLAIKGLLSRERKLHIKELNKMVDLPEII